MKRTTFKIINYIINIYKKLYQHITSYFSEKINFSISYLYALPFTFTLLLLFKIHRFLKLYFPTATTDQLLFFVNTPADGADSKLVNIFIQKCLLQPLYWSLIICLLPELPKIIFKTIKLILPLPYKLIKILFIWGYKIGYTKNVILISIILSSIFIYKNFGFIGTFIFRETSDFYEKHFIFPNMNEITFNQKKNIIVIYAESMENTFKDKEFFGKSLISGLESLEKYGNQFSDYDNGYGTGFTQGSVIALYTGIPPYITQPKIINEGTGILPVENYATLGKILQHNGYTTLAILSSNSKFAATDYFLKNNGIEQVIDKYVIKKIYPEKEYHSWGYDDNTVLEILKDKVTQLQKEQKPFFVHAFTLDTHANYTPYVPKCNTSKEICDNKYKRMINHSSNLIKDFVEWFQKEPSYKNTAIIIVGDHKRSGNNFAMPKNRKIYNLFINSPHTKNLNRKFTQVDLFPTVLEIAGAEIKKHRLGFGTSIFSSEKTMSEKYSTEFLNTELYKKNKLQEWIWQHKK